MDEYQEDEYQKIVYLKPAVETRPGSYMILLIEEDGYYPQALFHVDLLWNTKEHKIIYEKLAAGETVKCEIRLDRVS
jgi:hypothetical protein